MSPKRIICSCITLLLLAQPVLADVVVLKSGEKYVGKLANREAVRASIQAGDTIAILIDSSGELRRFPRDDVEYLILEDADRKQVIDLLSTTKPESVTQPTKNAKKGTGGAAAAIIGLGMVGVGAFVKFGGPKCTIAESSINCDDKSYNAINYVLIGCGAVFFIIGISESMNGESPSKAQVPPKATGLVVSGNAGSGGTRILVGYRYSF